MSRSWWPVAMVALLLGLLLAVLFAKSLAPGVTLRNGMHEKLQSFELHDAELSRDVLLARAGLLPNYDALAADKRIIGADLDALAALIASEPPQAQALLGPPLEALATAARAKLLAVEDFKSANAILRNSLAYLTKEGPLQQAELRNRVLPADFGRLSYAVLRYMQAPDPEVGREIEELLDRLEAQPGLAPEFGTLVTHGRMLRKTLPDVDRLGAEVQRARTHQSGLELETSMLAYTDQVERRTQPFLYALFGVSLLLLGFLVYQYSRLRASAADLGSSNASLRREMVERAQATAALQSSEARFRAITDSAQEAIVSVDESGLVRSWNHGATAMFGFPAELMLGTAVSRLEAQLDESRTDPSLKNRLRYGGAARNFECTGRRSDGSGIPLDVSVSSWASADGRFVTAIMRDVSPRKTLEETARQQELQLIQADKMTTVGTLVESVMHEIDNPNQAILANADALARIWGDALRILDAHEEQHPGTQLGPHRYRDLRGELLQIPADIRDDARRIGRTVAELKDFGRPRPAGPPEDFPLNETVERAIRLIRYLIRKRTTRFETRYTPNLPLARGDSQHLQQVVVNLVSNALEALPDPSCAVVISTGYSTECGRLELVVADEGVGIPRSHLARIADPFFTTKASSGGTGLGLAICASLLRAQGGALRFESESGVGTRAIVALLAADREAESCAAHNIER